jgi:hypothetical protein
MARPCNPPTPARPKIDFDLCGAKVLHEQLARIIRSSERLDRVLLRTDPAARVGLVMRLEALAVELESTERVLGYFLPHPGAGVGTAGGGAAPAQAMGTGATPAPTLPEPAGPPAADAPG